MSSNNSSTSHLKTTSLVADVENATNSVPIEDVPAIDAAEAAVVVNKNRWCACNLYDGNRDAIGMGWLATGRGMLAMSNMFMTISLLWLGKNAAGCYDEATQSMIPECDKEIYGMKVESLISNIGTLGAVLSALFMPICGAIVDYTPYRKQVGVGTGVVVIVIQAVQIFTIQSTWFAMGILQAVAAFVFQLQLVVVFAYYPEIKRTAGQVKMNKYNTNFSFIQYLFSVLFLVVITGIGLQTSDVVQAQISQGINTVSTCITFGIGWFVYITPRPANKILPDNQRLLLEGFKQNYRTAVAIGQQYKKGLRWYLLAVVFAEASATAVTTVAVIYLTSSIELTGTEVGIFLVLTLINFTLGTLVGRCITYYTNPNTSWKLSMVYLFVVLTVGALALEPAHGNLAYVWAVFVGLGLGWYYPTENLYFSCVIPPGSEAELSGFFLICGQILGWMFPLLFSILIERDVPQKYGVVVVATGFLIGCALLMLTSSWEEIIEEASHPMIHAATTKDTIDNTHKIIDPSSNRSGTDDALEIQSQPENEVEKAF